MLPVVDGSSTSCRRAQARSECADVPGIYPDLRMIYDQYHYSAHSKKKNYSRVFLNFWLTIRVHYSEATRTCTVVIG